MNVNMNTNKTDSTLFQERFTSFAGSDQIRIRFRLTLIHDLTCLFTTSVDMSSF